MPLGYRRTNKWTTEDEKSWARLVPPGSPQLILVDDPIYFRVMCTIVCGIVEMLCPCNLVSVARVSGADG